MTQKTGLLAALAVIALLAGCATPLPPAQIKHLENQFLTALPMGELMAEIAADDPNWPLQMDTGRFTQKDSDCMRREFSREKADAWMRQRADAYARNHPDRVSADVAMLDGGVANFLGMAVRAGKFGEILPKPKPQVFKTTLEFATAPRHAALREAMYMDGIEDAILELDGNQALQKISRRFLFSLMADAAAVCGLIMTDEDKSSP